ncbi:glyoxylate/hydroxypyruvate reductase A [Microcoleus sp. ARI1-B5]|uniref:2-hydroxyacid dehydrogenase n=1 Tax=unclassified Microcoleus TaxID=2642155 RepID=UPI002FD30A2E
MAVLLIGEIEPTDTWFVELIAELKKSMPHIDLRVFPDCGKFQDVEIALAWKPPLGALLKFPNLKLIISLGAGVDHILRDQNLPHNISIVRLVSPAKTLQMAEYVNLAVLFFHRRLFDYQQLQRSQQWAYLSISNSQSFTVGIMGLGAFGSTVAKRLRDIGLSVRGWSRTPKEIAGIKCFYGQDQFRLFLSKCRVLVCLLPLTSETENILNADTFSALSQPAYLVNVSRGKHLVEADLFSALDSGKIAGAFLDCFCTEPLPKDHPFWHHPRIIVTPHISAAGIPSELADQIIDTLMKFKQGKPLKNLVDLKQGY